jgi:hypothetical protein
MSKVYDSHAQQAILIDMVKVGELRLRQRSIDQIIADLAEYEGCYPLTDENLQLWFQKGWDHYRFDLPQGGNARSAAEMFRKLGKDW